MMAPPLTPRQQQVAALVADGYTDRQIAERLAISATTVGHHVEAIVQRLSLDPEKNIRAQIVRYVLKAAA